ncbi:MAG: DUF4395 family protein [Cyclobacteriaceae bacterium]
MKTTILSSARLRRLRGQGFTTQSDQLLSDMAFGIRFAYKLCLSFIVLGLVTQRIEFFAAMTVIAFLGVVLPNHPFDYIYNRILSVVMTRPKLPKRSSQLKFACSIATTWLASVSYLMYSGNTTAAMILAGVLASVVLLLSTTDICIPSIFYNLMFPQEIEPKVKLS